MELILFIRNLASGADKEFTYSGSDERDEIEEDIQKHIKEDDFEIVDFWTDDHAGVNELLTNNYPNYRFSYDHLLNDFDLLVHLNEDQLSDVFILHQALGYNISENVNYVRNGTYTIIKGIEITNVLGEYFEVVHGINLYEHALTPFLMDDHNLFNYLVKAEEIQDADKCQITGLYYIIL